MMVFIFWLLGLLQIAAAISFDQDMTITLEQKQILDKFKAIVSPSLPHSYMKTDIYLVRWLRARNFELKAAIQMLEKNLEWRKDNKMDDIQNENWDDFRKEYNYWIDGQDKAGRPILFLDLGQWDLRRAVLTGESKKLIRAYTAALDQVSIDIRSMQQEKLNVSQYYLIMDMGGYNALQHRCNTCMALLVSIFSTYDNYFTGLCHKVVVVHSPGIFTPIISKVINPYRLLNVEVYGRGKEGHFALLEDIDEDQLPIEVGGTRILPDIYSN